MTITCATCGREVNVNKPHDERDHIILGLLEFLTPQDMIKIAHLWDDKLVEILAELDP